MRSVALTIAGSDCSGGAGIQADLKTFHQHGVYGQSVITLLTAQNTTGVHALEVLSVKFVAQQLRAVLEDIPPQAAKTGALGNSQIIQCIAEHATCFDFPLVVDPVMISKAGDALVDDDAIAAMREYLLPCAFLVTPNIHEAAALTGQNIESVEDMQRAAKTIAQSGPDNVLIKGGALADSAIDVHYTQNECEIFESRRIDTQHTHGTGCVFSAAITANLARDDNLHRAVKRAKAYVTRAIGGRPGLGHGRGPIDMFVELE